MPNENGQLSVCEKIEQILSESHEQHQAQATVEIPPIPKWIIDHLIDYLTESDPEMIWGDEVYSEEVFKLLVLNMSDFALYVWEAEKDQPYGSR